MTTTRVTTTGLLGVCVAATLLDPLRIVMTALGLRRLRKANPELFDGAAALRAIELAIAEEGGS